MSRLETITEACDGCHKVPGADFVGDRWLCAECMEQAVRAIERREYLGSWEESDK